MNDKVTGWGWAAFAMSAYAALGAGVGALLFWGLRAATGVDLVFIPGGAVLGAILAPWLVTGSLRWKAFVGIVLTAVVVALARAASR